MVKPISSKAHKNEVTAADLSSLSLENETLRNKLESRQLFQHISNRILLSKNLTELRHVVLEGLEKLFPLGSFNVERRRDHGDRDSVPTDVQSDIVKRIIDFADELGDIERVNPNGKELIELLISQTCIASENIIAKEQIAGRDLENEVLLASSSAISSNLDINVIIGTVCEQLRKVIDFNDVGVSHYDLKSMRYRILACHGNLVQAIPNFKLDSEKDFPLSDGLHDVLLHSMEPVFFDYASLKALNKPQTNVSLAAGMRSVAGIRLVHNHYVIGALILTSNKDDVFSGKDFDLIVRLSHHLATAVSNSVAHQELTKKLEEIKSYKEQLQHENIYLQQEAQKGFSFKDIVGNSAAMQNVYNALSQVCFTNSTVLILGETGTGKELIARAIHNSSARADKLLVKVNCATLPAALIESELFGHEKGSFTGALERRVGKFELANNGTLFLDEIGEMPLDLQVKLLRAIQEREIERIGGKESIKVDVRIIAATNRDLATEVKEGRFRSDLYYRLNVFPVLLPPLRDRKDDIPDLARHFSLKFARSNAKGPVKIASGALKELMSYSWPGNVRELEHQIERSVIMANESVIRHFDLPTMNKGNSKLSSEVTFKTYEQNVRDHIIAVLNYCDGKIYGPGGAAQLLSLKVGTLNSKIRKLGINREDIIIQQFE